MMTLSPEPKAPPLAPASGSGEGGQKFKWSFSATDFVASAGVGLAYFVTGRWGLTLAFVHPSVTAVWAPSGIALAALLILGYRVWPGVFLGAFLVNALTAGNWATSLGIATGNTLEGVIGAYLVNRYAKGRATFERPQNFFKFIGLAAFLSTMVSATVGSTSLVLGGYANAASFWGMWWTWWLGDMAGIIVVAPCLILWSERPKTRVWLDQPVESALFLLALVVTSAVVFGFVRLPHLAGKSLDYLLIPLLFWSAFRFGLRETAAAALLLSWMAIWATERRLGPFATADPNTSLLLLQSFMGVVSVVGIVVASDAAERRRIEGDLRSAGSRLEQRVRARTEDLKKANEELGLFASMVSHELQEPLRKITMFADLLKDFNYGTHTEEKFYVERMRDASKRMSVLVQDILSLHKAGANGRPLERIDLARVLKEVETNFRVRLDECGGRLEIGPLPALDADESQIRRLFENLISNAYKFRRKDEPLIVRVVSRDLGNGSVEVTVEDNGGGFDPQFSERIFQAFERLHRKNEYEGSGLGLTICARIVERHGGHIQARGLPGKGAAFVVTLPLHAAAEAA